VFCNPVRARLPSFHDSECGLMTGVLPPFQVQSEDTRAMARHCSVGIELRMSVERFILLDTQPVFSPSVLADIMRPDGLSSISVVGGDPMSAELAHELMGLQLGMFLCSVCHIVLVVTEGVHDINLWRLMQTVEMLKQGISDPSISLTSSNSHAQSTGGPAISGDRDNGDSMHDEQPDFFADTVFLHTKFVSPTLFYLLLSKRLCAIAEWIHD
jgi:protein SMG9